MSAPTPFANWLKLLAALNEAQVRWYAAEKALELGHGGIERVHELTGLSRPTIRRGIRELRSNSPLDLTGRIRRAGAGRHRREDEDSTLLHDLECLLEATTAGDPMSALKWTSKSTRTLARDLMATGHKVSARTVDRLLYELDYSQQGNRKNKEGVSPPERDAQFRYINTQVKDFIASNEPVLSIDCKKKERVGEFKNPGKTWRKRGDPLEVHAYDFPSLSVGRAIPYGVYDVQRNEGLVNIGVSHETAAFAVETIRQWWQRVGRHTYNHTKRLLLCADGGGSNGSRSHVWKLQLQTLADETGLAITVCHYPPGASKWNKIEHRMFSFVSLNWRGKPLESLEVIVNLIAATSTSTGLKLYARLDDATYERGIDITDDQLAAVNITRHTFHGDWNYTVIPSLAQS